MSSPAYSLGGPFSVGGNVGGSGSSSSTFEGNPDSSATPYSSLSDGGDGYGAEVAELVAKFRPDYTAVDIGISVLLLVIACGCLVAMSAALVFFLRKRNVFEIRARSAYLTMLSGTCMMVSVILTIVFQCIVLFGVTANAHMLYTSYYFILVCGACCYGSRTIRLAVQYNGRIRKTVPWLASERNHVCACVLLGLASLGIPSYHIHAAGVGPYATLFFIAQAMHTLWAITIACEVVVLALYPLVWKIEDVFNIARELRVVATATFLVTVAGRLGEKHLSRAAARWVNTEVMAFLAAVIEFYVSLGLPIRQLLLQPLGSRDPDVTQVLEERKRGGIATGKGSTASIRPEKDAEAGPEESRVDVGVWTYEKLATIPEVSTAFEEFTRRALCQESLLFLRDVIEFQRNGHHRGEAAMSLGIEEDEDNDNGRRHLTFNEIVTRYIVDGAPDEVNISSADKSNIVRVYEAGKSGFGSLSPSERRFIFAGAYVEVRFVLESNLMNRFITTEPFKAALAEHQGGQDSNA